MAMFFHKIAQGGTRAFDVWGSGQFDSSRGNHRHQGLDVNAYPGEFIRSPIDGVIVRDAFPYRDDHRFHGMVISGTGEWEGFQIKLFYVDGFWSGIVYTGQVVGTAQDLSTRYPGITNHVHVEVRFNGLLMNPLELFGMCF